MFYLKYCFSPTCTADFETFEESSLNAASQEDEYYLKNLIESLKMLYLKILT